MIRPIPLLSPDTQGVTGIDPQTGDVMIRPLVPQAIRPAPTYSANAMPNSPSYGVDLAALGAQGLQGAQSQQRTAQKLSSKVGGLLSGDQGAGGLLGDIQGNAALSGLFATMQAIGRPVRRGEDRYLGAVQYGQQVMDQQRKRGIEDLSTQMQLEKYQREKQLQDLKLSAMQGVSQRVQGGGTGQLSTFSEYAIGQMDDNQKTLAAQSEAYSAEADRLAVVAPDLAKQFRDTANSMRDQALRGVRTSERANEIEMAESEKFSDRYSDPTNEVLRRRNSLIGLLQGGGSVGNYVAFVNALKSVEPDSAVLSSEFDSATSLGSLTTQLSQTLARLNPEDQLPEKIRQDLERVADLMTQASMDYYNMGVEDIKTRAARMNLNPDNIITPVMAVSGESSYQQQQEADDNPADSIRSLRSNRGRGTVR